jgi:hypothetical protein
MFSAFKRVAVIVSSVVTDLLGRTTKRFPEPCCEQLYCTCPYRRELEDDEYIVDWFPNGWTLVKRRHTSKTYWVLRS